MTTTTHFPDVSQFQHAVGLKGAPAVIARATEGDWLTDPDFTGYQIQAGGLGIPLAAYAFLEDGSPSRAQAEHCHAVVGKVPLMVDLEPIFKPSSTGQRLGSAQQDLEDHGVSVAAASFVSRPGLDKALAFVDHFRSLGGVCHLLYFPMWYWETLGRPSLQPVAARGLALVSSVYPPGGYTPDGPGWDGYGGMHPQVWQYTSTGHLNGVVCDWNAYRGTVADLRSLMLTGKPAAAVKVAEMATDGKLTLAGLAATPHNTVPGILRLTVQHSRKDRPWGGLSGYVATGDWGAPMPAGASVWYWSAAA